METICPNIILFGYDTEHMFENYLMKIFCHIQIPIFPKNMEYIYIFPFRNITFSLWGQTALKTQLQAKY